MSGSWLSEFEQKYDLVLFGSDEQGVSYFEKQNSYKWYVKIDENKQMISIPKLIPNSFNEREKKEKEIVNFLLENISNWKLIGLSNFNQEFEIQEVDSSNNKYIFHYSEKESLNAFGGKSWEEF